jgi:AraC-like DNA-binding protein
MQSEVSVYSVQAEDQETSIPEPGTELSGIVEKFWMLPRSAGNAQRSLEILPDSNFDLVFLINEKSTKVLYTGPFTEVRSVPIFNAFDYFCIRFRPGRMPRVADITPGSLVNGWADLPKVLGTGVNELGERLIGGRGLKRKQKVIEDFFRRADIFSTLPKGPYMRIARAIEASRGMIRVDELAGQAGMSKRTLERMFREQAGITPKTFIRMVRFQHAVSRLRLDMPNSRLADFAYDCGYADQSHFIKEFRALTHRLPGSFFE